MRDREEIVHEMNEARDDLARNVEVLRETITEKLDVRAHAERLLDRARDKLRTAPGLAVLGGLVLGMLAGYERN
jgi:hypothetical protein